MESSTRTHFTFYKYNVANYEVEEPNPIDYAVQNVQPVTAWPPVTNPGLALMIADYAQAEYEDRLWNVVAISAVDGDVFAIDMTTSPHSWLSRKVHEAKTASPENPVARAIKLLDGRCELRVLSAYVSMEDALGQVAMWQGALNPPAHTRSAEATGEWLVYELVTNSDTTLDNGTEIHDGSIIYVGRTTNPAYRLKRHIYESHLQEPRLHVANVIAELKSKGVTVSLVVLASDLSLDAADRLERTTISRLSQTNPLQNTRHVHTGDEQKGWHAD